MARFPQSERIEAFVNGGFDKLGAGEDAPPEYPMLVAVRNASDPELQKSIYYIGDPDAHTRPIRDLSE